VFLLCLFLGAALHAQNVVITQGEWNFLSPRTGEALDHGPLWASGSIGTNILLYQTLIQNDVLVNFGGIEARRPFKTENAVGEDTYEIRESDEFMVYVSDNIFVALNTLAIGLRAGFSGGIGVYSDEPVQIFLNIGFLIGLHLLPESLFSLTIDIKPGYTGAVHWDYSNTDVFTAFSPLQYGWTFPIAISIRLNLDKL
jgi:hypothetical protein